MLNGLDLFSGIGGLSKALEPWVMPQAYCEVDRYAQGILLSRMAEELLPEAPIWDDITTFDGRALKGVVDIIYGGFPCQNISVAGNGEGLEGERSGLFWEVVRLVDEVQPRFVFLENVPAIRCRGLRAIANVFTSKRYDSRWCMLSAGDVGAPHFRKRWWFLAYSSSQRRWEDAISPPRNEGENEGRTEKKDYKLERVAQSDFWQSCDRSLHRMDAGLPARVDRIKALGNAVVPLQAREAFKMLMGLENENWKTRDVDLTKNGD